MISTESEKQILNNTGSVTESQPNLETIYNIHFHIWTIAFLGQSPQL